MNYHERGGISRMNQLSQEEKKALSKKANIEKINPSIPKATHTGILKIGDQEIDCAVLSDGRRILRPHDIWKIMGRTKPNAKTLRKAEEDQTPVFLSAKNLKPFIINDLSIGTSIISYRSKSGKKSVGYECSVLTSACEAYLKARDAKVLTRDQFDIAIQCDIIMRGLAKTGLVALIDECTGYEEVRDRFALQAILDKYLRSEFAEWSKRFPPSFYEQIFRLNNWKFAEISEKRPMIIGKYTNDIVYSRLMPELVEELQNRNPRNELGRRETRHHQWLSDVGHIDLDRHISAVTALMKCCEHWKEFKELLSKVYPVKSSKEILIK